MKTATALILSCCLITSSVCGAPLLANIRAELKTLKEIGGASTGWGGTIPGRFYLLYPYCVLNGDEETFSDFMKDENVIVATMGALCLIDRFPEKRDDVLKRMKLDTRSVLILQGDMASPWTLKALFERIEANPDFVAPRRFVRKKPISEGRVTQQPSHNPG